MKKLPQVCPLDGVEFAVPMGPNFVRHALAEHRSRIGRARPSGVRDSFPWREFVKVGDAQGRTDGTLAIVWLDFPYSVSYLTPVDFSIEWTGFEVRAAVEIPWNA